MSRLFGWMVDTVGGVIFMVVLGSVLMTYGATMLVLSMDNVACRARWQDSGLETKYDFWSGCRVRLADGRWVPEGVVKQVEIAK